MFKLSVKNIIRYKYRTCLVVMVIFFSSIATVLCTSMMEGLINHMLNDFINYDTAHIRVIRKDFKNHEMFYPLYFSIGDLSTLVSEFDVIPGINRVIPMIRSKGFINKENSNIPVRIIGVDFQNNTFNFDDKIFSGSLLEKGVIMGGNLAKKLSFSIGDNVLLSTLTSEHSLNALYPKISAITHFAIPQFDKHTIFISLTSAQQLFKLRDSSSEVFLILSNITHVDSMVSQLRLKYPYLIFETYKEQMGLLYQTIEVEKKLLYIIGFVIMIFGSMVVVTSMSSGIYERFSEIGMLKAMGYTNVELSHMLFFEGLLYGICGGITGLLSGYCVIRYFSIVGLNFSSGLQGADIPMSTIIYPSIKGLTFGLNAITVVIVPIILSLYPMHVIRKILPIQAIIRDF